MKKFGSKLKSIGKSIGKVFSPKPLKFADRIQPYDYDSDVVENKENFKQQPKGIDNILSWVMENARDLRKLGMKGYFLENVDFLIDVNDYLQETNQKKKRQRHEHICKKYISNNSTTSINIGDSLRKGMNCNDENVFEFEQKALENTINDVYKMLRDNISQQAAKFGIITANAPRISHRCRRSTSRGRQGHRAARTRCSPRKQSPRKKCHGRVKM